MPNKKQWVIFVCTVAVLILELIVIPLSLDAAIGFAPNINGLLFVGLTAFVGFFLYRVAGKAKSKKYND